MPANAEVRCGTKTRLQAIENKRDESQSPVSMGMKGGGEQSCRSYDGRSPIVGIRYGRFTAREVLLRQAAAPRGLQEEGLRAGP